MPGTGERKPDDPFKHWELKVHEDESKQRYIVGLVHYEKGLKKNQSRFSPDSDSPCSVCSGSVRK